MWFLLLCLVVVIIFGLSFIKLLNQINNLKNYDKLITHLDLISNTILATYFLVEIAPYKLAGGAVSYEQLTKLREAYIQSVLSTLSTNYKKQLRQFFSIEGLVQYLTSKFDRETVRQNALKVESIETKKE